MVDLPQSRRTEEECKRITSVYWGRCLPFSVLNSTFEESNSLGKVNGCHEKENYWNVVIRLVTFTLVLIDLTKSVNTNYGVRVSTRLVILDFISVVPRRCFFHCSYGQPIRWFYFRNSREMFLYRTILTVNCKLEFRIGVIFYPNTSFFLMRV